MRISGYGSSFGQTADSQDRAASFRSKHSIGQRIKGRILKRDPNGLYWVKVGGEELLARLEVQADPGDQLLFIVRALSPEIMLQALSDGEVDVKDLPSLVQRFRAAREVFEVQHTTLLMALVDTPPQAELRRESFSKALDVTPDAAILHARTQEYIQHINTSLAARQNAQAMYLPWLTPGLRRQEIVRRNRTDGSVETALSAQDADCGSIEARLLLDTTAARLSISAQLPERTAPLQVELAALSREASGFEPSLLGVSKLKPSPLGGVLGELLGNSPMWSSGILNTRV